jgi:type II secretion system protein G
MTEEQKRTVGVAVASLVLGILGFVLLGPLGAIPAVICGHIAKSKIKRDPEHLTGDGMALAGLIMGYVQIGLMVVMVPLMAAIAIPSFVKARSQAQVHSTRATIAALSTAVDLYEVDTGRHPSSLASLVESDGSQNWDGPYMRERVVDAWGTPFAYEVRGGDATIISAGPDRAVGTSDDITNR